MAVNLIDVWNVETFDEDLIATLRANSELVRNYIVTDREIFLEREASGLRVPYRTNPHAESYGRFLEDLDPLMKTRTIRAWHYTRLTDTEVIALRTAGIYVSTLDATRRGSTPGLPPGNFQLTSPRPCLRRARFSIGNRLRHAPTNSGSHPIRWRSGIVV